MGRVDETALGGQTRAARGLRPVPPGALVPWWQRDVDVDRPLRRRRDARRGGCGRGVVSTLARFARCVIWTRHLRFWRALPGARPRRGTAPYRSDVELDPRVILHRRVLIFLRAPLSRRDRHVPRDFRRHPRSRRRDFQPPRLRDPAPEQPPPRRRHLPRRPPPRPLPPMRHHAHRRSRRDPLRHLAHARHPRRAHPRAQRPRRIRHHPSRRRAPRPRGTQRRRRSLPPRHAREPSERRGHPHRHPDGTPADTFDGAFVVASSNPGVSRRVGRRVARRRRARTRRAFRRRRRRRRGVRARPPRVRRRLSSRPSPSEMSKSKRRVVRVRVRRRRRRREPRVGGARRGDAHSRAPTRQRRHGR